MVSPNGIYMTVFLSFVFSVLYRITSVKLYGNIKNDIKFTA